jgi:NTP pyrophosphatase (non-canonical NTP hydrolase)
MPSKRQILQHVGIPDTGNVGPAIFGGLTYIIGKTSEEKGFWGPPEMMDKYVAKLALIHSEVTEVMEALRKNQGADKVTEEFADIFIRCFDLHRKLAKDGYATDDLYDVIRAKMVKNADRPAKHGHSWG